MKLPAWVNSVFSEPAQSCVAKFDIVVFKKIVEAIRQGNKSEKFDQINALLSCEGLINHHQNKTTRCKVMAVCEKFEYEHEHHTAIKLTGKDYDVILVPNSYFKRHEKKFDVFLSRGHIFLEADLKCIRTTNTDTIGNRIKEGSEQSSRIVLDVVSNVGKAELIDGLKTGCERNEVLFEILLFYNSQFYCLRKEQILSKNIYKIIK